MLDENHDKLWEELDQLIIDIYVTGVVYCVYYDDNGDTRRIGEASGGNAKTVICLGDESHGGWTARIIRFLRGDYLDSQYHSFEQAKKRYPDAFDDIAGGFKRDA